MADRDLTQEELDKLLLWLNPDREQAGKKYEEIRRVLVKIFTCRGCFEADELADKTINRVAQKVAKISETYVGNPANYFYNVAYKIYLEYQRRKPNTIPLPSQLPTVLAPEPPDDSEYECLEQCMQRLTSNNRELIRLYYQEEKQARIAQREILAKQLGIKLNNLRVKVFRITSILEDCIKTCIKQRGCCN